MIYDRKTQSLIEQTECRQGAVNFLYQTLVGRVLLGALVSPAFSNFCGIYEKSALSKKAIKPFIRKYNVPVSEDAIGSFHSFNDFFTRKKDVSAQTENPNALLAIADSKMRYYPITEDLHLTIKNSTYDLTDILGDQNLAAQYHGGTCIVFRLSMNDYHRYHFLDDGKCTQQRKIKGVLHTVRPISEKYRVYSRNSRQISTLETAHFGTVVQAEIGALLVGKIHNHHTDSFSRMEEKGYFEFGGSTVVLLLNKPITFDEDIAKMNESGIEIQVCAGERIGILQENSES